ncbi:hypothetical protein T439DRAFT_357780 [Meredithblackwellia eburnea MCA 4105]
MSLQSLETTPKFDDHALPDKSPSQTLDRSLSLRSSPRPSPHQDDSDLLSGRSEFHPGSYSQVFPQGRNQIVTQPAFPPGEQLPLYVSPTNDQVGHHRSARPEDMDLHIKSQANRAHPPSGLSDRLFGDRRPEFSLSDHGTNWLLNSTLPQDGSFGPNRPPSEHLGWTGNVENDHAATAPWGSGNRQHNQWSLDHGARKALRRKQHEEMLRVINRFAGF